MPSATTSCGCAPGGTDRAGKHRRRRVFFCGAVLCCLAGCAGSEAEPYVFADVPPLPAAAGVITRVASVAELRRAVDEVQSNSTIILQPGRYVLTEPVRIGDRNRPTVTRVSFRGATGERGDVVLEGAGLEIANGHGVLVSGLTFARTTGPAIQISGEAGAEQPHIHNVRFVDIDGTMIRVGGALDSRNGGVGGGIVEHSSFEYTNVGPSHSSDGAIAIAAGGDWIVRFNVFRNIRSGRDASRRLRPALLVRGRSSGARTHNNLFIDCERAIAYGMAKGDQDPDNQGGAIYNNFVFRRRGLAGDAGIMLWSSPQTKVFHNTVIQNGTYQRPIEYRFPLTKQADIRNNLTDGPIQARDGAEAVVVGNFTKATPAMFRNPQSGDLRLLPTALAAIDTGVLPAEWPLDWDGDTRPAGRRPDIGADEYAPAAPKRF
jgi:hypothetical protein